MPTPPAAPQPAAQPLLPPQIPAAQAALPPQAGQFAAPQFTAPRPAPQATPKQRPKVSVIGVGALVVGFLLVGAFTLFDFPSDEIGLLPGPGPEESAYAESEEFAGSAQTVEDYLVALSEGDADTARELLGREEAEPLLGDDALGEAISAAPISDIAVEPGEASDGAYDASVSAVYSVGDRTVERKFQLWRWGDGWTLVDGDEYLALAKYSGLGLTLGGVDAEADGMHAFPIAYPAELESPWFDLAAAEEDGVVVLSDTDAARALDNPEWLLNADGVREFRARVSDSLEQCTELLTLTTPCGMSVREQFEDGWVPLDGTVERTLEPESVTSLRELEPVTSHSPITRMTVYTSFSANVTLDVELDGEVRTGDLAYPEQSLQPYVDFSDPDLTVTWE